MTRRRTFAAIAVVAAVLITAGLGAYQADEPTPRHDDFCGEDFGELFEMCAESRFECGEVADEYADACQAGCVMSVCSEHLSCTQLDPIWCAPCTDMYGATYWLNHETAGARCQRKLHFGYVEKMDQTLYQQCFVEEVEQLCPDLVGTDWLAKSRAARGLPAL